MGRARWATVRLFALATLAAPSLAQDAPTSGTVALTFEMGSPVVTLTLRKADGSARPTRFLVDTGGGALMLAEPVATELGLNVDRSQPIKEEGMTYGSMATPRIEIDAMPLDLEGARCMAVLDSPSVMTGTTPEGFLPGHVLMRHHVVFDYPAGRFTLAHPGTLTPRGEPVPTPIQPSNGFPRLEVEIGGERFGFLLDTGASFSMVSIEQLKRWQEADDTLPWMTGAVGDANMIGGPFDSQAIMMRLPAMRWGPFEMKGVAAVSRRAGTFERNMSGMMTAPIVGALGTSLLRRFRVEIDYAAGITYLEPAGEDFRTEICVVGLVIGQTKDGRHRVDGVPFCAGVQPGDFIRSIDGTSVEGLCHRQVVELLRGERGALRKLVLDRQGETVEVNAPVGRLLLPPSEMEGDDFPTEKAVSGEDSRGR